MEVSPDARIFEVDGPSAWHRLCTRYPAQGENGQLVPNWPEVAREWDAVHLTLGGLLASEQVRVEMSPGSSEHCGWDAEQTVWLRWCFTSLTRLPDLSAFPQVSPDPRWPWTFMWPPSPDAIERRRIYPPPHA